MAQNVGAINADTNAIFEALRAKGVSVPANAQLSDVADMIESIEVPITSVEIEGRSYPVVRIGNQLWMAEPIKVDSITHKTREGYDCYYYQWDSTVAISNMLPDGWRIPTVEDINVLKTFMDSTYGNNALSALKSTEWGGTNESGFNAKNIGFYYDVNGDYDKHWYSDRCMIWTSTFGDYKQEVSSNRYFDLRITPSEYNSDDISVTTQWFSIRAMCDASGYVTIGGRQYKTVTIGNQEWLAENLDYKFSYNGSTLPIGRSGTPSTPAAWYYNNNEASYGIDGTYKCGLLYNWYAAKYLDDNKATLLPSGWHVPTLSEWNTLITNVGGISVAGLNLKAAENTVTSNWPDSQWGGNNTYGFNSLPAGRRDNDGIFTFVDANQNLIIIDEYSQANMYRLNVNITDAVEVLTTGVNNKTWGVSLRLVRTIS